MADFELKQDPHYAFGYYIPGNNKPPESRDKDLATTNWVKFSRIPRLKHNWTVGFELSPGATQLLSKKIGSDRVDQLLSELTLRAQSVDLPTWNITTQTLNQYNKQRHVHTRVDWQQVQVKFLDTVDNAFQALLTAYMEYYFPNNFNDVGFNAMQPDQLKLGFKGEYGLASINDANNNFFITMVVNREYGGWVDQTLLINPKITAVQHDTLDYTDAGSTLTWTITLQYESVVFRPSTEHEDQKKYSSANSAANEQGGEMPDVSNDDPSGFPPEDEWPDDPEPGLTEQEPGWTTGGAGDLITGPTPIQARAAAAIAQTTATVIAGTAAVAGVISPGGAVTTPNLGNKPPANLAEQIGDKLSQLNKNITQQGGQFLDKISGGNIGVGKAINPTTIAGALSLVAMVKRNGVQGIIKNPVAAAGIAVAVAKQLPALGGTKLGGGNSFGGLTDGKINKQASVYEQAALDLAAASGKNVSSITNMANLSSLQKFIKLG